MKSTLVFLFILLFAASAHAQDTLVRTDGTRRACKVTAVNDFDVVYRTKNGLLHTSKSVIARMNMQAAKWTAFG